MLVDLETPKSIIDALRNSKNSEETKSIVQYVSKEFFSDELQSGQLSLAIGDESQDVKILQTILCGLGYLKNNEMSGKIDEKTIYAIKSYSSKYNVSFDVNQPIGKGIIDLFTTYTITSTDITKSPQVKSKVFATLPKEASEDRYNWPPVPTDLKYLTVEDAQRLYGPLEYKSKGDGGIIITNNFEKDNIITIEIPQLAKIQNPRSTRLKCHRLAAKSMIQLWQEWENAGLLSRVITFNGCYYPRFIRGSNTTLSNHAFGVAFDINTKYNGLFVTPPAVGEKGSVRELVPIANKLGFYWGGHYRRRKDGMHFELSSPQSTQYIV
jgi:hypothetical protein